jgi:hypothetical protein
MKQIDFDASGMSLKDYRNKFGKDLPLCVVKTAYGYSQNGHAPQQALATAAALYAEPFKQHDLLQLGLFAEKQNNTVTIWNLQTETVAAQQQLLQGEWDYHNRAMCIARLSENYACTRRTTLEFLSDHVVGVYAYKHCRVAVAELEQTPEANKASSMREAEKLADLVAQNAVNYFESYQLASVRYKQVSGSAPSVDAERLNPGSFKDFLLGSKMRFVEGINPETGFLCTAPKVSVAQFLQQRGEQLGLALRVLNVKLFDACIRSAE